MKLVLLFTLTLTLGTMVSCHLPKADPLPELGPKTVYPVRIATGDQNSYHCSGVEIYPNWVLTAAHCANEPMWADDLKAEVVIVPNAEWDMAMARVPGIKGPDVVWTDHRPKVGEISLLIGWGCDHVRAKAQYGTVVSVDDRDITYDVPICFGDSGGPVYDQNEHLIGLIVRKVASNSHAVVQYLGENM